MIWRYNMTDSKSQSDKFEHTAHELEPNTNEKHWEERLRITAKAEPEQSE
jgi:hypothetical protein